MGRKKGSTRLRDPSEVFDHGVPPSKVRRANSAMQQWFEGDVDKVEFRTTPDGEKIVETYNRNE